MSPRHSSFPLVLTAVVALAVPARAAAARQIEDAGLRMPEAGDYSLHVLTPTILELTVVTSPPPGAKPIDLTQCIRADDFRAEAGTLTIPGEILGCKRRVLYAPLARRDLRVTTSIYLGLERTPPVDAAQTVKVTARETPLWSGNRVFTASTAPLRYSPAIHVNQEGYEPALPKTAFVGYFMGTAGELPVPADTGFDLVEDRTGNRVFHGALTARRDTGFTSVPMPYQQVYEADFSRFQTPGEYRLVVPGLGASLPFRIAEGEILNVVRAVALGLYHQRCGVANELPYTRFTHDACHTAPADVPLPAAEFPKAWEIIGNLDKDSVPPERPERQLKTADEQKYPIVRRGKIDVAGGHHDAGDYSKYTTNSASLVHALMFAVDSLPGVAGLDNLGLPESGDDIGDVLQEAKREADFLAKLQDDDGGFYFLVYPRERRYESGPPDPGDPQIVWPKNTAATAAAVAALAQCAGSPEFKRHYPAEAGRYLAQARRGWQFLLDAIARYGRTGAYQRLTHYGDPFQDDDELAWAACELFVATGDHSYERKLLEWYPNPGDARTRQYGWRRAAFAYGNALRSYAFASRSGRLRHEQLDSSYVAKCEAELRRAGEDALRAAGECAYGASYPAASKRLGAAGWFFASDEAFDLTVAYQLQPLPRYAYAVLTNLDFELGANPVNRVFITGLGQRRQREIVHQYAQADGRVLPPTGLPLGSLQSQFHYMDQYKTDLRDESWPADDGAGLTYPLYDRWSDAYNLNTEFVIVNQGRILGSLAFWAAQTPVKGQAWKSAPARIVGPAAPAALHRPVVFQLECPGLDLSAARIVWEGRDQEPAFGPAFTMTPRSGGAQWVEAEAALPDGRRVFAHTTFPVDVPVVFWVNGALPAGASAYAEGGDGWHWLEPVTRPKELAAQEHVAQHESALAGGIHEHGFDDAEATLPIEPDDVLFAYVYPDPAHPPATIMLEWNDGSREHRAFWGANLIPYGRTNTAGQRPMGPLPAPGRWTRLEVAAGAVGLEGRTIKGMYFRLHGGRALWDAAGKRKKGVKDVGASPPAANRTNP